MAGAVDREQPVAGLGVPQDVGEDPDVAVVPVAGHVGAGVPVAVDQAGQHRQVRPQVALPVVVVEVGQDRAEATVPNVGVVPRVALGAVALEVVPHGTQCRVLGEQRVQLGFVEAVRDVDGTDLFVAEPDGQPEPDLLGFTGAELGAAVPYVGVPAVDLGPLGERLLDQHFGRRVPGERQVLMDVPLM